MAGNEVRAYNVTTGAVPTTVVGPSRSRLQGVLVNGAAYLMTAYLPTMGASFLP